MKKPLFTEEELKIFRTPGNVRRINSRLLQAQHAMRPLHFQNLEIQCQFLHIGPGIYPLRWTKTDWGPHQHPDLQLEFVFSGRFKYLFGDIEVELQAGDVLFIPPNVPHTWNVVEPGAMFGSLIESKGADRETFFNYMLKAQERGRYRLVSKKAEAMVQEIFPFLSQPRPVLGGVDEIAAMLDLLHIELVREQCNLMKWRPAARLVENQNVDRSRQIADRAMRFIEVNHAHSIQLRDVALHVGVSSRHVNRVFEKYHDTTINKALLRIRLEHAFQLLSKHPGYAIKSIALDCGFSSAAYFTRCFHQAYGMSPLKAQGR